MKQFLLFVFCISLSASSFAQTRTAQKMQSVFSRNQDSVQAQLQRAGFSKTPVGIFLRSFKYNKELQVWLKPDNRSPYKLFKTYAVCTQSGTVGPKRVEGDYQVPEGVYYINEFNPNSAYHLSMGLNYPNASDRILSDPRRPGSAIYVHGNCISTGCIPITDRYMEELYVLSSMIKEQGMQEFIPIHVFPINYTDKKSLTWFQPILNNDEGLKKYNANLKEVFDYFETKKELPIVLVNGSGEYVVN